MATRDVSGWTVGFAVFAGVMLMMIGVFHALAGLAAIIDDQFFVVSKNYAFEFDTTAWGWLHLIFGVILVFAGYRIFSGVTWARLIIALDILVIAALCAYGTGEAQGA